MQTAIIGRCCAECVGGVIAGMLAGPLYGVGSPWLKKMLPWIKETEVVDASGKVVDKSNPSKKESEQSEIYDTTGTDGGLSPLYAGKPDSGGANGLNGNNHEGLTTLV